MTPALFADLPRELIERFDESGTETVSFSPVAGGQRLGMADYAQSLGALAARPDEVVALYVHLPFCPVRCLYCACHTTITHDGEKIDRYLDTLEREMDLVTAELGGGRALAQLHLGGGTPNYLTDSQLIRLMEMVGSRFHLGPDTAATIECNPRRASASQLELLKGLGFKGVSFGIQDLDVRVQHAIGRVNSLGLVRDVCTTARETGFECISLDLVYGLPNQTLASFESTLERIIEINPDRIRVFSYSHRPAIRPHQYAIETACLPGAQEKLALLHSAVRCFTESGYTWIGLDCFVRDGDELADAQAAGRLRHTALGYTCAPTQHLLAFGTSSLGEVDGTFVQNESNIDAWRKAIEAGCFPILWGHRLTDADQRRHRAIAHLLCNLALPASLMAGLEGDAERLVRCAAQGLIELTDGGIKVTQRGRYFLRSLCTQHEPNLAWSNHHWGEPQTS
ncbi:oxygen-independent coproporphyrinogen III oxidase [uncultured Thiodictyon sp.]|uniref:oxygen-independent coproporphyrinogen III oxidase n=1 Tax=uncultured Thiodictyon sp. TaxID=1846217 RepID=UPI0025F3A6CA|nr:oxygen-independent coproporphyrinogen III oxidase [uncultured Thiodictyon sp.]